MVELGKAIQQSKIRGFDTKEIMLIESVVSAILKMAAKENAGTFLNKLNRIISSHIK